MLQVSTDAESKYDLLVKSQTDFESDNVDTLSVIPYYLFKNWSFKAPYPVFLIWEVVEQLIIWK